MKLRIVLTDDHRMFRDTLRRVLDDEPGLTVVGEAGDGAEALQVVGELQPDVMLLDIGLPGMSGIEVARQIQRRHPRVKVIALTGHSERPFVEEMMRAGALGYVLKSTGVDELLRALRAVAVGQHFLSTEVIGTMLKYVNAEATSETPPIVTLTPREQAVLSLLAGGRRSADIATELDITVAAVEVHRRNIKGKLGLHTTAELTRYAIREGLIPA
ncbi:MAG: response regulator transcription factor [Zoogloea sp.]|nr:MAG: response regulator transcription factor [Zoogloea sp.]